MNNSFYTIILAAIIFVGPNSQALLSNAGSYDMKHSGYHCSYVPQFKQINILYDDDNMYVNTCHVVYTKNGEQGKTLWKGQRTNHACVTKAGNLALRLSDRGWHCKTAGLTLEEIPQRL